MPLSQHFLERVARMNARLEGGGNVDAEEIKALMGEWLEQHAAAAPREGQHTSQIGTRELDELEEALKPIIERTGINALKQAQNAILERRIVLEPFPAQALQGKVERHGAYKRKLMQMATGQITATHAPPPGQALQNHGKGFFGRLFSRLRGK